MTGVFFSGGSLFGSTNTHDLNSRRTRRNLCLGELITGYAPYTPLQTIFPVYLSVLSLSVSDLDPYVVPMSSYESDEITTEYQSIGPEINGTNQAMTHISFRGG